MGVSITCDEESFSCSYSTWNTIRTNIIEKTLDYLNNHFSLNECEDSNELIDRKNIIIFFENILSKNDEKQNKIIFNINVMCNLQPIDSFIQNINFNIINALIYFNIGGLYSLCYKSDCEGYYSVGNSYDILNLITLIKPCINKEDNYLYHNIVDIEKIFQESIKKNKIVIIC
jgi:hypothetical protein